MQNLTTQVLLWSRQNNYPLSTKSFKRIELLEQRTILYHSYIDTHERALKNAVQMRLKIREDLLFARQVLPNSVYSSYFKQFEEYGSK